MHFFDIRKIYAESGSLKKVSELDDDTAAAIAGVETLEAGEFGISRKVKIWDKKGALDSICKVMGYNEPEKIAGNIVHKHEVIFKKMK